MATKAGLPPLRPRPSVAKQATLTDYFARKEKRNAANAAGKDEEAPYSEGRDDDQENQGDVENRQLADRNGDEQKNGDDGIRAVRSNVTVGVRVIRTVLSNKSLQPQTPGTRNDGVPAPSRAELLSSMPLVRRTLSASSRAASQGQAREQQSEVEPSPSIRTHETSAKNDAVGEDESIERQQPRQSTQISSNSIFGDPTEENDKKESNEQEVNGSPTNPSDEDFSGGPRKSFHSAGRTDVESKVAESDKKKSDNTIVSDGDSKAAVTNLIASALSREWDNAMTTGNYDEAIESVTNLMDMVDESFDVAVGSFAASKSFVQEENVKETDNVQQTKSSSSTRPEHQRAATNTKSDQQSQPQQTELSRPCNIGSTTKSSKASSECGISGSTVPQGNGNALPKSREKKHQKKDVSDVQPHSAPYLSLLKEGQLPQRPPAPKSLAHRDSGSAKATQKSQSGGMPQTQISYAMSNEEGESVEVSQEMVSDSLPEEALDTVQRPPVAEPPREETAADRRNSGQRCDEEESYNADDPHITLERVDTDFSSITGTIFTHLTRGTVSQGPNGGLRINGTVKTTQSDVEGNNVDGDLPKDQRGNTGSGAMEEQAASVAAASVSAVGFSFELAVRAIQSVMPGEAGGTEEPLPAVEVERRRATLDAQLKQRRREGFSYQAVVEELQHRLHHGKKVEEREADMLKQLQPQLKTQQQQEARRSPTNAVDASIMGLASPSHPVQCPSGTQSSTPTCDPGAGNDRAEHAPQIGSPQEMPTAAAAVPAMSNISRKRSSGGRVRGLVAAFETNEVCKKNPYKTAAAAGAAAGVLASGGSFELAVQTADSVLMELEEGNAPKRELCSYVGKQNVDGKVMANGEEDGFPGDDSAFDRIPPAWSTQGTQGTGTAVHSFASDLGAPTENRSAPVYGASHQEKGYSSILVQNREIPSYFTGNECSERQQWSQHGSSEQRQEEYVPEVAQCPTWSNLHEAKSNEDRSQFWVITAVSAAAAVITSGEPQTVAQVAADAVLTAGKQSNIVKKVAAEVSVAILEAGGTPTAAAAAAVAILEMGNGEQSFEDEGDTAMSVVSSWSDASPSTRGDRFSSHAANNSTEDSSGKKNFKVSLSSDPQAPTKRSHSSSRQPASSGKSPKEFKSSPQVSENSGIQSVGSRMSRNLPSASASTQHRNASGQGSTRSAVIISEAQAGQVDHTSLPETEKKKSREPLSTKILGMEEESTISAGGQHFTVLNLQNPVILAQTEDGVEMFYPPNRPNKRRGEQRKREPPQELGSRSSHKEQKQRSRRSHANKSKTNKEEREKEAHERRKTRKSRNTTADERGSALDDDKAKKKKSGMRKSLQNMFGRKKKKAAKGGRKRVEGLWEA